MRERAAGAAWQLTLTYELLEVNEDLVVRASETLGKKYVYADGTRRALPLAQTLTPCSPVARPVTSQMSHYTHDALSNLLTYARSRVSTQT